MCFEEYGRTIPGQKLFSSSLLEIKCWEQVFLIRSEVSRARGKLGQEGRASWPGSSKQLTDWLCVMVGSGCIFINSSRLICSAEACKAVWACLCSAGVRDWAVRVQRGNLQEVGHSPEVTWQKTQGHREELFICLKNLPTNSFYPWTVLGANVSSTLN